MFRMLARFARQQLALASVSVRFLATMSTIKHGNKGNIAERYSVFAHQLHNRDGMKLVGRLDLKPGDHVIDLGCGTGYLSSVMAERVGTEGRVVAIDPDVERLKIAQRDFGHVTNLTFCQGSSDEYPDMGSGRFNAVFSNYVLHWIAKKECLFRKLYKSLAPGGRIAFRYTINIPLIDEAVRLLAPEFMTTYKSKFFFESGTAVKDYCIRAGFTVIENNEFMAAANYFETKEDFLEFCEAVLHGLVDLTSVLEESKEKFMPPRDSSNRVIYERTVVDLLAVKETEA